MLRVTLERVGADGQAVPIGRAVVGRWAGGHIAAITDDRKGPHVGKVEGHDPADGVWTLVRDAIAACLTEDAALTDEQLAVLERQLGAL